MIRIIETVLQESRGEYVSSQTTDYCGVIVTDHVGSEVCVCVCLAAGDMLAFV